MCETSKTRSVKDKLEYIRIRLFLMASSHDFDEMVNLKVHLYNEHDYIKELCKRMGVTRRNISKLERIAKARFKAIENIGDAEFYNQIAEDIVKEIEMDVVVLPENIRKYSIISTMYS